MKAIIMAGGKGTRLYDAENPSPKVLRMACGRPLLSYVLDTVHFLPPEDVVVLVGFMADAVRKQFPNCHFAEQGKDAYGTGYAVRCALEQAIDENYDGDILVLSGDMPLIRRETVAGLVQEHKQKGNVCTLLSCVSDAPLPYGRILRDSNGRIYAIREDKDCSPEEKNVRELNSGLYVFSARKLRSALERVGCNTAAGEYYLTDVPPILIQDGEQVGAYRIRHMDELLGVNTPDDLRQVEETLRQRSQA